jgi:phosphopantetheine adenylyltransferase
MNPLWSGCLKTIGRACRQYKEVIVNYLSDDEKERIVKLHNENRMMVSSSTKFLLQLWLALGGVRAYVVTHVTHHGTWSAFAW